MPTVANMPDADVQVTFPNGVTKTIFMPRLYVQVLNAEFKRDHGMFLPNVGKQHPTVKSLREEYELDYLFDRPVRTWADCAAALNHFYNICNEHIKTHRGI